MIRVRQWGANTATAQPLGRVGGQAKPGWAGTGKGRVQGKLAFFNAGAFVIIKGRGLNQVRRGVAMAGFFKGIMNRRAGPCFGRKLLWRKEDGQAQQKRKPNHRFHTGYKRGRKSKCREASIPYIFKNILNALARCIHPYGKPHGKFSRGERRENFISAILP